LAYNVANQINAFHSAGYDEMGAAAGDLLGFSKALVGVAGAAAALTVDAAVAAASRLVAAAAVANGGDNRNARAIAALREQKVLNGNTASLSDSWAELVYRVGRDTKAATDEARSRAQIVAQVDALRDQVSGISLDEEAMNLLKFQRAYEANGFFSAIDRTIALMMKYLGR
jgi:flagellar hook-associated protein 1 FlgK